MRIWIGILALVCLVASATAQAGASEEKKTIGKLGQAIEKGVIYNTRSSSKGRVLSRVKQFQYLVVNKTDNPAWISVVLVNGRLGYMKSDLVAELPYDVQVPKSMLGGTTSRGGTGRSTGAVVTDSSKQAMLEQSFNYIGTPYKWGGNSLTGGIDCSGFVKELYEGLGVNLPRTARQQAKVGQPVERLEDLQPGDRLYFWDKKRGYIGHTGIFLGFFQDGGAYFIHSSSNNKGVATDDLRNKKWRDMLVGARRDVVKT